MRKIRNLPKDEQARLSNQYADLEMIYEDDSRPEYTYFAVSVFDHWLTRDEFYEYLSDVSGDEQELRNTALFNFSKKVVNSTKVLNFKWKGTKNNQKLRFREFRTRSANLDYLSPAIAHNDKELFECVLPDLNAVFLEGYEDTNVFYLKDPSVKPLIQEWAKETGLYCLEHWSHNLKSSGNN